MKTKETAAVDTQRDFVWTGKKLVILNALKSAGGVSATSAVSAAAIVKASKNKTDEGQVKRQFKPIWGLVTQEYVKIAKQEDGIKYFLTQKGLKKLATTTAAKAK